MYAYQNQKYHMLIIQHHFFGFVALDLVFFDTKVWRAHQQKFDLFFGQLGSQKGQKMANETAKHIKSCHPPSNIKPLKISIDRYC